MTCEKRKDELMWERSIIIYKDFVIKVIDLERERESSFVPLKN